jgi:hypothetical protein
LIDFLTTHFSNDWTGVSVEKSFARVYEIDLPIICIRANTTTHIRAEIGEDSTVRTVQILLDIFAENDGQKLDLTDYIVEKLKGGCPYYEYVIKDGAIDSKTEKGRVRIMAIEVTPIDFNTDKDKLDTHDRYRTLITLSISLGRVES